MTRINTLITIHIIVGTIIKKQMHFNNNFIIDFKVTKKDLNQNA